MPESKMRFYIEAGGARVGIHIFRETQFNIYEARTLLRHIYSTENVRSSTINDTLTLAETTRGKKCAAIARFHSAEFISATFMARSFSQEERAKGRK